MTLMDELQDRFAPRVAKAAAVQLAPAEAAPVVADPGALQRVEKLRAYVASLQRSALWREAWNDRLPPAGSESAGRVAQIILDDMAAAVAAGDVASLDSRERWLRKFVTGEAFDTRPVR